MSVELALVVDVANVVGSRPDGWWRDRAGAAQRLLARLAQLPGRQVRLPGDGAALVSAVVAVVEGQARAVSDVAGVHVVRAPRDGDTTIAEEARRLTGDGMVQRRPEAGKGGQGGKGEDGRECGQGRVVLVVTADRGLRDRLPAGALAAGPRWLDSALAEPGPAPRP